MNPARDLSMIPRSMVSTFPSEMQHSSPASQTSQTPSETPPTPPPYLNGLQPDIYQRRPGVFIFYPCDNEQRLREASLWTWLCALTTSRTSRELALPDFQDIITEHLRKFYLPSLRRAFVTLSRFLNDQISAAEAEWQHDEQACAVARGLRRFEMDYRPYSTIPAKAVLALDWGSGGLENRVQERNQGYWIPPELCAVGIFKAAVTMVLLREERERVEAAVNAALEYAVEVAEELGADEGLEVAEELGVDEWSFE